ncbi:hypothetical protein L1994_03360 [Methanomicrobium antiquum]|uniref:Uncharacterized protein n=1 Tax=Methanomicrobium antiquum TaxID=487686 RepID=A0AAF0FSR8_9EURY|nr:hypothetical protein [Methanomicrobium antiquum]WFN37441.1 hypothetical protein L1994_03360 [Methanomicrobium antiquum]
MKDNKQKSKIIHFLLLGNSKEHINRVIEYYEIRNIVFFTSINLINENLEFIKDIKKKEINVLETVLLDPFEEKALENMTKKMLDAYSLYSNDGINHIIAGLTGGTNLMVLSMGMLCFSAGLKAHYVVNNENNDVITIDIFQNMVKNGDNIQIFKDLFKGEL